MTGLTTRQEEILAFINEYLDKHLQMPTLEEIARNFEISPAGAFYHLKALEKKKLVKISRNISRGIELTASDRVKRENISIPFFDSEPDFEQMDEKTASYYISRENDLESPFAFKITSFSMKEAGILPSDIAIMDGKQEAKNGDIVLAYIPESHIKAELRRFIKTPYYIELRAENENMGSVKCQNAVVYGILKALRRNY